MILKSNPHVLLYSKFIQLVTCSPGEAPEAWDPQNWAQRPPPHVGWEGLAQWRLTPQRLQVHQLNEQTEKHASAITHCLILVHSSDL